MLTNSSQASHHTFFCCLAACYLTFGLWHAKRGHAECFEVQSGIASKAIIMIVLGLFCVRGAGMSCPLVKQNEGVDHGDVDSYLMAGKEALQQEIRGSFFACEGQFTFNMVIPETSAAESSTSATKLWRGTQEMPLQLTLWSAKMSMG